MLSLAHLYSLSWNEGRIDDFSNGFLPKIIILVPFGIGGLWHSVKLIAPVSNLVLGPIHSTRIVKCVGLVQTSEAF